MLREGVRWYTCAGCRTRKPEDDFHNNPAVGRDYRVAMQCEDCAAGMSTGRSRLNTISRCNGAAVEGERLFSCCFVCCLLYRFMLLYAVVCAKTDEFDRHRPGADAAAAVADLRGGLRADGKCGVYLR